MCKGWIFPGTGSSGAQQKTSRVAGGDGWVGRSSQTQVIWNQNGAELESQTKKLLPVWQVRKRELNAEEGMGKGAWSDCKDTITTVGKSGNCVSGARMFTIMGRSRQIWNITENINVGNYLLRMHVLYGRSFWGDAAHTFIHSREGFHSSLKYRYQLCLVNCSRIFLCAVCK